MEKKKMILVVEDQPDESTYLTSLFEDQGYCTECAKNGIEALEKVKKSRPDLITLDISMPEKTGIKFYREIREDPSLAKIPVLVITGITGMGGNPDDFQRFLSTRKQVPPPDGFIPKPVDTQKLMGKVKELVGN